MTKAFLMGAGVTTAEYSRAPICKNFFGMLEKNNKLLFSRLNGMIYRIIGKNIRDLNVEDVMKTSKKFHDSEKTVLMDTIYKGIYDVLATETKSTEDYFNYYVSGNVRERTTGLRTLLLDPRLEKDDFFMTLNYDLYLDREVVLKNRKIDYGLDKTNYSSSSIPISKNENYSVYHLHGALNWRIGNSNLLKIEKGAISPIYSGVGSNVCLVPPGGKRFDEVPALNVIWNKARNRLLDSDELIIIGCSLNKDDKELISLVKKFADKNGIENIKVICVNGGVKDKTLTNCKELFGMNFKNYYTLGFSLARYDNSPSSIEYIFGVS